ncbi:FAD/NAD(P)-binding domain-containing protein [Rhizodiscina lignyota]|uniref:FAD/NAD(P)-binding domain-containing protein n=1 Tax=Rhizodiscina lignyota TaxID=1504668 RepID=A0A9P4IQC4_9PEZI|nr:FAD/NAD(P)-binding domain-containing protein [Rhizodiscina lignyota]
MLHLNCSFTIAQKTYDVIIVGAGPVGLLVALRLGQQGIPTLVLEAHHELLPTTRAMVYMPMINRCLHELGLTETIQKNAFLNHDGVVWRDIEGNKLAQLPLSPEEGGQFGGTYQIGQARMNQLILTELMKCASVDVKFGLRCVGIEDDASAETIKVMAHQLGLPDGDLFFEGKYVLGADGNASAVRRMMCIPFDGYTFAEFKMIGMDILFDFGKEFDWTPLNFFVNPDEWGIVAFTGQHGGAAHAPEDKRPQWRVAFVEPVDLPTGTEEYIKRGRLRIKNYLKDRTDYEIVRAESYWLHQRCAAKARKGRVMLAGDALHHGEPDSVLTDCATSRRDAWLNATAKFALGNLHRLADAEGEQAEARKEFFDKLNNDPGFPKAFRKNLDSMMPETFELKSAPMPEKMMPETFEIPVKTVDVAG